tara:strand:- start:422 stop:1162 length:741 start_codon:yes stop_codon:yes gene_type:complete
MAKELPYFKFEPSEWQNGDIQMLDAQTQLTFINICCTYWNRLGKLPYAFALHKHCNGNAEALDLLISCNIIKLNDSNELIISFLDLQLKDVKSISSTRSNAAKTRWAKGNDANALQMQSKSNAIRQDKIREDKIIVDKIIIDINERKNTFSLQSKSFNNIYEDNLIEEFVDYWTETKPQGKKMLFEMQKTFQIKLRLKKWYANSLKFNNGKTFNNSKPTVLDKHKASYNSMEKYIEQNNPFAEYDD